jgi:hypothetical protein
MLRVVAAVSGRRSVKGSTGMQDIIFVGIALAFFALCVAYVRGLDRLVRGAEEAERATDLAEVPEGGEMAEVTS